MVRQEHLNPMGLDWRNFLVAEVDQRVIGIGQVKPHADRSRELASLAVQPEHRSQGAGARLVQALLARENGTVYLFCKNDLATYYQRFGFYEIPRQELPVVMARLHRLGNLMARIASRFSAQPFYIIGMKREKDSIP